jgi:hypothetical protein
MFRVLCFLFLCVWPGMVPNQRQLTIVVSDQEPYLGSLFSHFELWVIIFWFVAPVRTVRLSFCCFCSPIHSSL